VTFRLIIAQFPTTPGSASDTGFSPWKPGINSQTRVHNKSLYSRFYQNTSGVLCQVPLP